MKKIILFSVIVLFAFGFSLSGQVCESATTPDPTCENITCPDLIPRITQGIYFEHVVTVNLSSEILNIPSSLTSYLSLLRVSIEIEGLPEGIEWCKSSEEFSVGNLYCIQFFGMTFARGNYPITLNATVALSSAVTPPFPIPFLPYTVRRDIGNMIVSENDEFVVAINPSTTRAVLEEKVVFKAQCINGPIVNWEWIFEGGQPATSTDSVPVVVWNKVGNYNISLKATNDLGDVDSTDLKNMNVRIVPVVPNFTSDKTTALIGEEVHFFDQTLNDPERWYWEFEGLDDEFDQNPVVKWNTPGVYSVKLTTSNSGRESVSKEELEYMTIIDPNSIENTSPQDENIRIFPNPATNQINIDGKEIKTVELFDMSGKRVFFKNVNGDSYSFDVSDFPKANYLIKIEMQNNVINKKISIQ